MQNQPVRGKTRRSRWAWPIFAAVFLLNGIAISLLLLNLRIPITPGWGVRGFPSMMSLSFGFLGALILARYPRHRIGWLFESTGVLMGVQAAIQEYSYYAIFAHPGIAAGGEIAAWVFNWIWVPLMIIFLLIFTGFPDGKLSSPKWRPLIWFSLINFFVMTLAMMFAPGPLESSITTLENPFGLLEAEKIINAVFLATNIGFILIMIGAALVLIQRYRDSKGIVRQQLKWFMYAVFLMALTSPTGGLVFPWHLPLMVAMVFLPIAAAIAIFRYRLYDIDLLIRRTLQYALLTGLLALIYFGAVVLLQEIFGNLAGEMNSPLITVISTLSIAALFNPLRLRIQDFIDRRFYRKKYDAEQALAQFAAAARDEVDMERLTVAMLTVIEETMQPENLSLLIQKEGK